MFIREQRTEYKLDINIKSEFLPSESSIYNNPEGQSQWIKGCPKCNTRPTVFVNWRREGRQQQRLKTTETRSIERAV